MIERFEIGWIGGAAERRFRKIRPDVRELPWGTLDPKRYSPILVRRAREMWTQMAAIEYATAARFAEALEAMLVAKAPLDLVGMAGDFVADEASHAEIATRVVNELGGGVPLAFDYATMKTKHAPGLTPFQRASEIMLRLSCVAEAFSAYMTAGVARTLGHPLTKGAFKLIARDEARHGRIGDLYMEWACGEMDDAERARLGAVALEAITALAPYWKRGARAEKKTARRGFTADGHRMSDVSALGWMASDAYAARAKNAVRVAVVSPLARVGIDVDARALDVLLA